MPDGACGNFSMLVYDLHVAKRWETATARLIILVICCPQRRRRSPRGPLFCAPSPSGVRMHLFRSVPATIFLAGAITVQARSAPKPDLASTLYVVPYAHLDTQWRWEFPQTIQRVPPEDGARELLLLRQISELPSSTGPAAIATASRRSTSLLIKRG